MDTLAGTWCPIRSGVISSGIASIAADAAAGGSGEPRSILQAPMEGGRMRPVLVCCALMTALSVATIARAQINLAWNDCITQPGSAVDVSYACDGSRAGQPYRLVPSFICPADLPQFVGVQMVIDVTTDSPTLPDWWRLGVGDCRANTLLYPATAEFNSVGSGSTGACRNPWLGGTIGGGSAFYVWTDGTNPPLYTPNRGRIKTAIALQDGVALEHGAQYHAGVLTIETEGKWTQDRGRAQAARSPRVWSSTASRSTRSSARRRRTSTRSSSPPRASTSHGRAARSAELGVRSPSPCAVPPGEASRRRIASRRPRDLRQRSTCLRVL